MLNKILAVFFERDIQLLVQEIRLFTNDADLWKTTGSIKNSAGNLALHIAGGLNYLIGNNLAGTGYIRDREAEFSRKGVAKEDLLNELEGLIPMIVDTLNAYAAGELELEYPVPFDGQPQTRSYVLVQLLSHLNYHSGQVNYLRRVFDEPGVTNR